MATWSRTATLGRDWWRRKPVGLAGGRRLQSGTTARSLPGPAMEAGRWNVRMGRRGLMSDSDRARENLCRR